MIRYSQKETIAEKSHKLNWGTCPSRQWASNYSNNKKEKMSLSKIKLYSKQSQTSEIRETFLYTVGL